MADAPFDFIPLDTRRSKEKPRSSGLTMIVDDGIALGRQEDELAMAGAYADFAKIKVGSARLYDADYLRRKIALYRNYQLDVFPGGQFVEYALFKLGRDAMQRYWDEALRLGFTAVEISDNVLPLSDEDRKFHIRSARDAGLRVLGEIGAKYDGTDVATLVHQAEICLEAGADLILVEAAELVSGGVMNEALIGELSKGLDMQRVLIELPGPWISNVTLSLVEDMKKALIRAFGVNVNIGNVYFESLMDLEAARVGLGVEGPPGMNKVGRKEVEGS